MSRVLILNGPNLARLGTREPDIYGAMTFEELSQTCREFAASVGLEADVRQTDSESELISWIHEAADESTPMVINPAAFTHYSYALRDACAMLTAPAIEVHLSNPLSREEFRHTSVVSGVVNGTIAGFGVNSYLLALRQLAGAVA